MVAVRVGNKRKIDPVTALDVFPGLGHPVRGAYEPHLLHNWGIRPPPGRREKQPAGVVAACRESRPSPHQATVFGGGSVSRE